MRFEQFYSTRIYYWALMSLFFGRIIVRKPETEVELRASHFASIAFCFDEFFPILRFAMLTIEIHLL